MIFILDMPCSFPSVESQDTVHPGHKKAARDGAAKGVQMHSVSTTFRKQEVYSAEALATASEASLVIPSQSFASIRSVGTTHEPPTTLTLGRLK